VSLRIDIQSKNVDVGKPLSAQVERQIRNAIGRFEEFIRQVTVYLAGHSEKLCRIRVTLAQSGEIELEESDADLQGAIARATGRLGLVVFGELWRARETSRNSRRQPESRSR
jgi:ribosome-associated translation inhibitor RaiA